MILFMSQMEVWRTEKDEQFLGTQTIMDSANCREARETQFKKMKTP